jgi:uncharacterized damage-inducible protein DinB
MPFRLSIRRRIRQTLLRRAANIEGEPPMKAFLLFIFLSLAAPAVPAQSLEGVWQGYDGEWLHVSNQLVALAEATPPEKFSWRPAPGVRSVGEVYMHIVLTNFYLLRYTGPEVPPDLKEDADKTVTSKPEVIAWLKRSLEAVKTAHLAVNPKDLQRKLKIHDRDSTVDAMYLRIIVHANEHMGQLIAYARMTGVVPPWSK